MIQGRLNFVRFNQDKVLNRLGMKKSGRVQQFIDNEVLRLSDPYVPFRSGDAKDSGTYNTVIGSGNVIYRTSYIRDIYFDKDIRFSGAPMRGAYWFERMKADKKDEILQGAKKMIENE